MLLDRSLAMLHHLLAFGLLAILVAEAAELRRVGGGGWLARLSMHDRLYGLAAVFLIGVGVVRVWLGAKGATFYLGDPWFWAKMAAFITVGALSALPTVVILRWARRGTETPPPRELVRVRRCVHLQLLLFPAIPVLAAVMATGGLG